MKKILIAGGAGFIGSHLCERFLTDGHEVICLDNFVSGAESNINNFFSEKKFHLINKCVNDITINDIGEVDEIYNFACPASPKLYQLDPITTLKTNFLGTLSLLEIAKVNGAFMFQASTSEVYGDPQIHPQIESYKGNVNPVGVRSCYDEGKRCAESLCFEFHRQYGLNIKIGRIFNTYGPRMSKDDGRVISNFVVKALNGESLHVYGDGSQTRSFCYIDDLIEAIANLNNLEGSSIGPINLGNPEEISIQELANLVIEMADSKSDLQYKELPFDDPRKRQPNISLAKDLLGWNPEINLRSGLRKTIEFYLENT